MLNQSFVNVLKTISERMENNGVLWAVVGSTNLALQGIEISPHDIDIIILVENLSKIKNIFSEYHVSETEEMRSLVNEPWWRVKIDMDSLQVEILGEKNTGIYANRLLSDKVVQIPLNDFSVPCLMLESEMQVYKETGRKNKADLIEKFLRTKKNKKCHGA